MAKQEITAGETSRIVHIFINDSTSTSGAGLTGLVFNSAGLVAYYMRDSASSATAITLATMTLGTWATGGFKECSSANMPGLYQIGIPDAAIASGAKSVVIMLKGATNMVPVKLEIQLDAGVQAAKAPVDSTFTVGTMGRRMSALGDPDGTAQAGTSTTITLVSTSSTVDNYYKYQTLYIITGTGAGQSRLITGYVGSTKVATVGCAWATNPDNTSQYILVPSSDMFNTVVETAGSYTAQQALSIGLATLAGESPAAGTFKTPNGASTRVAGAVTVAGVRSAITLTPSAP